MPTAAIPAFERPTRTEYPGGVENYVSLVPPGNLIEIVAAQAEELARLIGGLSDAAALVHHAPYTWSIKQVLGHLADCERVFGYRLMRIARNDTTPLPGFDENAYMQNVDFDQYPAADLLEEVVLQRRSYVLMLRHLPDGAWLRMGTVNGHPMTARAAACVMVGHMQHHLIVVAKRLA